MRSKIAQKILDETPAELRFPTRFKPHREPLVFNGIDFNRRLDLEKLRIHHSISMSRIMHDLDCKAKRDKEMIFRMYKETGWLFPAQPTGFITQPPKLSSEDFDVTQFANDLQRRRRTSNP